MLLGGGMGVLLRAGGVGGGGCPACCGCWILVERRHTTAANDAAQRSMACGHSSIQSVELQEQAATEGVAVC